MSKTIKQLEKDVKEHIEILKEVYKQLQKEKLLGETTLFEYLERDKLLVGKILELYLRKHVEVNI